MTGCRIILVLISLCLTQHAVSAPKVVVTIAPVHSLVSAILEGAGQVELLFPASSTPHGAGLKPSQVRALSSADLVVRVDPVFELAVDRALHLGSDPDASNRVLTLTEIAGMRLYGGREVGRHHNDQQNVEESNSETGHGHHHSREGGLDPHLWLSTDNAAYIVNEVAMRLAILDPDNAALYRKNAAILQRNIAATKAKMSSQLQGLTSKWLFFHDAYQYLEKEFGLSPLAVITTDPERAISGKRLRELVTLIEREKLSCIFIEPQLRPDLINRLVEKTDIRVLVLDPLGSSMATGPQLWFELMNTLGAQLSAC